MLSELLAKLPPEQVAELSGVPLEKKSKPLPAQVNRHSTELKGRHEL